MAKVYCSKCKYYKEITVGEECRDQCHAPDNHIKVDTYSSQVDSQKGTPREINAKNDCSMFAVDTPQTAKAKEKVVKLGLGTIMDHEARLKVLERKVDGMETKQRKTGAANATTTKKG